MMLLCKLHSEYNITSSYTECQIIILVNCNYIFVLEPTHINYNFHSERTLYHLNYFYIQYCYDGVRKFKIIIFFL